MPTVALKPTAVYVQASRPRAAPPRHLNSLDGLRALAVLAVMGLHCGYPPTATGWIGVDVFFALSGFLITTLLCAEHERYGTVSLGRFWARRACRLMPAYWLYVGSITALLVGTSYAGWTTRGHWTPHLFLDSLWVYFVNLAPAGLWTHQNLTYHLWSLAMEEQFYFAWPLVCVFSLRLRRPWLVPLIPLVALAIWHIIPTKNPGAIQLSYVRGIGIVAGCAVALFFRVNRGGGVVSALSRPAMRNVAFFVCVAAVVVAEIVAGPILHHRYDALLRLRVEQWLVPPFVVLCSIFIAGLWYGPPDRVGNLLAWNPLAYLGRISYGMYLYHLACLLMVRAAVEWLLVHHGIKIHFYWAAPAFVMLVITVASLSYWLLERPFLRLKAHFKAAGDRPSRPPTFIAPGATPRAA
jgi:peptidoglycan/LPS O-acetylase OafA/YrhL